MKQELNRIVEAGKRQLEKEKIRYFVPTEVQDEFIRDKSFIRLLMAANKVGKTTINIIEVICHCIGYRPFLSPNDPDYKTKFEVPIKARIYGEDFTEHIGGVICPTLYEWIPYSEFEFKDGNPKKNPQGIPTFWRFKNGSTIELLTYEQDPAKSEGWDGQLVAFDEPPPRATYIAVKRGLVVHDGICIFSLTPLKEPWIYDQLWLRQEKDTEVRGFPADITSNLRHRRFWWRPDGKDGKAWTGRLSQAAIDRFERDLTDDEKEARLHGRFIFLAGLVYKEFNPSIHRVKYFKPSRNWTWYEAIDPGGGRKEQAVLIMAVAPDNTKYVVDEIWQKAKISEIADFIHQKRRNFGYQPALTLIDPWALSVDPVTHTTIKDEFIKHGIFCQEGSKDRSRGIQLLKEELTIREGEEKAGIYVFENCRRTLFEFGHYIWDEYQRKRSGEQKDAPRKENDDMLENIHRLLIAGANYRQPTKAIYAPKRVIGIGNQ